MSKCPKCGGEMRQKSACVLAVIMECTKCGYTEVKSDEVLDEEVRRQLQALGDALAKSTLTFELSIENDGVVIVIRVDKHLLDTVKDEIWNGLKKHGKLSFFPID